MSVSVSPFELPLRTPLSTARGTIDKRRGFVVRATVDGFRGVGEATPLPGWTESLDDCRRALSLVDSPVAALDAGILDDTPAARHAVSLALVDARARAANVSLARWLGGEGTTATTVPVNATVGDGSPTETADAVATAVADGYDCVKLKVGVGRVERDLDRIRAVRDVAPDVDLRVDANGAWSRAEADDFVAGLSAFDIDLDYVEQPLAAADIAGHAELRQSVTVAVDETLASHSVGAVLSAEAADVFVLKPMALGGPDRALSAAAEARAAGGDVVVTTTIDAVVARTGALHVAAALGDPRPCGLATGDLLARDLAPDPAPVAQGRIDVPDEPGLAGDTFDTLE